MSDERIEIHITADWSRFRDAMWRASVALNPALLTNPNPFPRMRLWPRRKEPT